MTARLVQVRVDNLRYAGVRPEHEPADAERHDGQVLPQDPVVPTETVRPEGDDLDQRRKDQRQGGAADGADQRNDRTQVGNHGREQEGEYDHPHAQQILTDELGLLGVEPPFDRRAQDRDGHVELQPVGEENGQRHHDPDQLGDATEWMRGVS